MTPSDVSLPKQKKRVRKKTREGFQNYGFRRPKGSRDQQCCWKFSSNTGNLLRNLRVGETVRYVCLKFSNYSGTTEENLLLRRIRLWRKPQMDTDKHRYKMIFSPKRIPLNDEQAYLWHENNGDLLHFRSIRVNPCSFVVKILSYLW